MAQPREPKGSSAVRAKVRVRQPLFIEVRREAGCRANQLAEIDHEMTEMWSLMMAHQTTVTVSTVRSVLTSHHALTAQSMAHHGVARAGYGPVSMAYRLQVIERSWRPIPGSEEDSTNG
ncbi:MAG: hypothetical protein HQ478_10425 [Chloroflexi bacterium]|nr:hypothetical protein [Chloroflexota bacterium]